MAECASRQLPTLFLREELGNIGRNAEEAMLAATAGSNAHRGAIWVLGLLIAARAIVGEEARPSAVAETAGVIARLPDRFSPAIPSNGARVCQRYGVAGARGEAQAGFPHVVGIGLPTLWSARERGVEETYARLDGLIAIMAHLQDTCLLHRGGWAALEAAQAGARAVMDCGGTSTGEGRHALSALENALLAHWASPGGSADLLAACLFLDEQPLFDEVRVPWSN
jgi:triphosphoribosyl-dephospho-CoA synthase